MRTEEQPGTTTDPLRRDEDVQVETVLAGRCSLRITRLDTAGTERHRVGLIQTSALQGSHTAHWGGQRYRGLVASQVPVQSGGWASSKRSDPIGGRA